jgi:hypothetical protein
MKEEQPGLGESGFLPGQEFKTENSKDEEPHFDRPSCNPGGSG